jgi:hypothetical protein
MWGCQTCFLTSRTTYICIVQHDEIIAEGWGHIIRVLIPNMWNARVICHHFPQLIVKNRLSYMRSNTLAASHVMKLSSFDTKKMSVGLQDSSTTGVSTQYLVAHRLIAPIRQYYVWTSKRGIFDQTWSWSPWLFVLRHDVSICTDSMRFSTGSQDVQAV